MGRPQMSAQALIATARALVAGDKGLLAMDESNPTCNKRFAKVGIPQNRGGSARLFDSSPDCRGRWRFRWPAPFSNRPWSLGPSNSDR